MSGSGYATLKIYFPLKTTSYLKVNNIHIYWPEVILRGPKRQRYLSIIAV